MRCSCILVFFKGRNGFRVLSRRYGSPGFTITVVVGVYSCFCFYLSRFEPFHEYRYHRGRKALCYATRSILQCVDYHDKTSARKRRKTITRLPIHRKHAIRTYQFICLFCFRMRRKEKNTSKGNLRAKNTIQREGPQKEK